MVQGCYSKYWLVVMVFVAVAVTALPGAAQDAPKTDTAPPPAAATEAEPAAPEEPPAAKPMTVWQQVVGAGVIEYVIIAVSIAATTLIIDNLLKIRVTTAMPPDVVAETQKLMKERAYNDVLNLCQSKRSYFADVLRAGLLKLRHDFSAVQEAVTDALDKGGSAMHSKIGILSFLAKIAPMLGLLGTVVGMINSFGNIARASALNKPELLAQGVSQALITTATGLTVAIPVMLFYFVLRDRVNRIILEVETTVTDMLEPFRPTRKG